MHNYLSSVLSAACAVLGLNGALASAQIVGGEWIVHSVQHGGYLDGQFGAATTAVGDVNGDGCTDYVVGSEFGDPGESNCGAVEMFSGKTGVRIFLVAGGNNSDGLGAAVAGTGDMNGDGIPDVAAGAPRYGVPIGDNGAAYAFHGATGTRMWFVAGDASGDHYGMALAAAGDLNGDGFADLLAGAPDGNPHGANNAGYVQAHHGLNGVVLLRLEGAAAGDQFGAAIASPGDVTGDGVFDVLVGAPGADPGGLTNAGSVFLHSGATGALLRRWDGAAAGDGFGTRLAAAGDVDGDGFGEALVGAPEANPRGRAASGLVVLIAPRTGAVLRRWEGAAAGDRLGSGLAGGLDLDGDHVPDLALGAPDTDVAGITNAGQAWVFSGANGALIHEFAGTAYNEGAGASLALLKDASGDGRPDWLMGLPRAVSPTQGTQGAVQVFRHNRFLTTSTLAISAATGGMVIMSLEFPPAAAFHEFAVLVSRSGTGPTSIGGLTVPLARDALLAATLAGRLPAFLIGFRGVLSVSATGGAAFAPRPGELPAALAGTTLHFAAVSRPPGGLPTRSSSALALRILP